jgi:hypothetical protein
LVDLFYQLKAEQTKDYDWLVFGGQLVNIPGQSVDWEQHADFKNTVGRDPGSDPVS